jgi:hypothetical protein
VTSIWIHHPELDRYSEIEDESLAAWEDAGWVEVADPRVEDTERFSETELAARREQLAVEFPGRGIQVAPSSDQAVEASTGTPSADVSTAPASLNQDSGTPQED